MISEKGLLWASDYWSANVYQQVKNELDDGSPYGSYGDTRWQIIALSEGWANYREWKLAKIYLNWNSIQDRSWNNAPYSPSFYSDAYLEFPSYYMKIFENLEIIGCSNTNIEKALCSYSVSGFKDILINCYPSLKSQIQNIVKSYE